MQVRQIPLYATAEPTEMPEPSPVPTGPVIMGHNVGAADPASAYVIGIVHGMCIMFSLLLIAVTIRALWRPRPKRIRLDWPSERL